MKKKTHRIYARDKDVVLDGLQTSKGRIEFGAKTAVYVDADTAKEVDERYGLKSANDSVMVAKDDQYERALNGEKWDVVRDSKRGDWVKTLHKYRFQGVDMEQRGGNEKVKVETSDGYTFMSREKAEELNFVIIPQKREKRRLGAEEHNAIPSH